MYEQKKIIMKWAFFCPTMYSQWPTNISELYVFAHTCTHNDQQQKKVKQFFAQTKRSKPRNEENRKIGKYMLSKKKREMFFWVIVYCWAKCGQNWISEAIVCKVWAKSVFLRMTCFIVRLYMGKKLPFLSFLKK